jgi:hypothetical protein
MKFPIEYADKLLFVDNTIRLLEYMVGSKQYGCLTYQCSSPNIILERSYRGIMHSLYANNWACDFTSNVRLDLPNTTFNGLPFNHKKIGQWHWAYTAEFIGDINSFLEDATFLWFRHQD